MINKPLLRITVSPAFGQDYRSKKEAMEAWHSGRDFFLEGMDGRPMGSYCSIRDFPNSTRVSIRYARKTKQTYTDAEEL
jgi:hypothetical protein